ncbi:MAG: NAD-binding protein [Candidatus Micrarchaeota archaeon]|nr:NAD-binding protein [Candidatus Micrarchaeota archaeon]
MVEFRAIQKFLVLILLVIFAFSVVAALAAGQSPFISVFWSFMNIIGADFPPNNGLIDPTNPLLLIASTLDIQGRLIITIVLTTVFYQLLGGINLREKFVQGKIARLSRHVVIVPMEGIALEVAKQLKGAGKEFIVIEPNLRATRKLLDEGMLAINADATQQQTLERAGIKRASHLTLLGEDDMMNTLIAIEAKKLNPSIRIIARIKRQEDVGRMTRAGISSLILPEVAVGNEIAMFMAKVPSKIFKG